MEDPVISHKLWENAPRYMEESFRSQTITIENEFSPYLMIERCQTCRLYELRGQMKLQVM